MENKNKLKLVYIRPITDGLDNRNYEYDFLFSETPEVVWGLDWTDNTPNLCGDISPEPSTYSVVKRLKCPIELKTIQENSCYSMEYAINRSIALGWLSLEGLEEYPEYRMVFHFGDSFSEVEDKLFRSELEFSSKN